MLDALGPRESDDAHELERLGETEGFGWLILELLERAGWELHAVRPFAGQVDVDQDGIMLVAAHPQLGLALDVRVAGPTVADCAPRLLERCSVFFPSIRQAERDRLAARRAADGDAADLAGAPPR